MALTYTQLELDVLTAVAAARSGRPPEDDRVEFKSDWPKDKDRRQFAGLANRLRGQPLIYVIGMNERGELTSPAAKDTAAWSQEFLKKGFFEGNPPRPSISRNIVINDQGDSVLAVTFETDEFPYVVRIDNSHSEVPMRVHGGTQSATRFQLLELLRPTLNTPHSDIFSLNARVAYNKSRVFGDAETDYVSTMQLSLAGEGGLYIEGTVGQNATILIRDIEHELTLDGYRLESNLEFHPHRRELPTPTVGAWNSNYFAISNGPGIAAFQYYLTLNARGEHERADLHHMFNLFAKGVQLKLKLTYRFTGSDTEVVREATATRNLAAMDQVWTAEDNFYTIGNWSYR